MELRQAGRNCLTITKCQGEKKNVFGTPMIQRLQSLKGEDAVYQGAPILSSRKDFANGTEPLLKDAKLKVVLDKHKAASKECAVSFFENKLQVTVMALLINFSSSKSCSF